MLGWVNARTKRRQFTVITYMTMNPAMKMKAMPIVVGFGSSFNLALA